MLLMFATQRANLESYFQTVVLAISNFMKLWRHIKENVRSVYETCQLFRFALSNGKMIMWYIR